MENWLWRGLQRSLLKTLGTVMWSACSPFDILLKTIRVLGSHCCFRGLWGLPCCLVLSLSLLLDPLSLKETRSEGGIFLVFTLFSSGLNSWNLTERQLPNLKYDDTGKGQKRMELFFSVSQNTFLLGLQEIVYGYRLMGNWLDRDYSPEEEKTASWYGEVGLGII